MIFYNARRVPCVILFVSFILPLMAQYLDEDCTFWRTDIEAVNEPRVLKSPGYPHSYPTNVNCLWMIESDLLARATVTVDDVDLKTGSSCTEDYLTFKGGTFESYYTRFSHVRTICGDSQQFPFFMSYTAVIIEFRSGAANSSNRGFTLNYRLDPKGCPERLRTVYADDKGVEMTSPEYPDSFYSRNGNIYCHWLIRSTREFVRIQIKNLDIDGYYGEVNCSTNYLKIYNGNSSLYPLLGSYCRKRPSSIPFISSSKDVYVEFGHSDSILRYDGFRLVVQSTDTSYAECPSELVSIVADDEGSEISSPAYPNIYAIPNNNGDPCRWLVASTRAYIKITLEAFDLDGELNPRSCDLNFLNIFNGNSSRDPILRSFCEKSSSAVTFTSESSVVLITFNHEWASFIYGGFKLFFNATDEYPECPSEVVSIVADDDGSEITSPAYPDINTIPNNNGDPCRWLVASTRAYIKITLEAFDLDGEVNPRSCDLNFLNIFNGNSSTDPILRSFCEKSSSAVTFTSGSSTVFMTFNHEWTSFRKGGFKLVVRATDEYPECPSELVNIVADDEGSEITSPAYPDMYAIPNNDGDPCRWLVASTRTHIKISLETFDLVGDFNTRSSYLNFLNISNGNSSTDPILRSFWEKSSSTVTFTSGSSVVLITFNHEWSPFRKGGFKLVVQATDEYPECPSELVSIFANDDENEIISPGYPNIYEIPNNNGYPCRWLVASTRPHIKITVEAFDLDGEFNTSSCDHNFLKIVNGNSPMDLILRSFCEKSSSAVTFTSESSMVLITFNHEWTSFTNGGFKLFFQATDEYPKCPSDLVSIVADDERREITSPAYPDMSATPNNNGDPCRWLVASTRSYIEITLEAFDLDGEVNPRSCDLNFLNIYEGNSSMGSTLRSFCEKSSSAVTFTSRSSMVLITFNHEWTSFRKGGFKLLAQATDEYPGWRTCYKYLELYDDWEIEIVSPGFPHGYPTNMDCWWSLRTFYSSLIRIEFITLNLSSDAACANDKLDIYHGPYSSRSLLASFNCENSTKPEFPLYSSSNYAAIKFKSGPELSVNSGFKIAVKRVRSRPEDESTEPPDNDVTPTDSDNTKIIIIVVVVVVGTCIVFVAICIFIRRYRKNKALQNLEPIHPTMPRPVITPGNVIHTDSLQAGTYHPDVPSSSLPESERNRPADIHADLPPSYHESTSNSANRQHLSDPPPYTPLDHAFGNTAYIHTEGADHHILELQRL